MADRRQSNPPPDAILFEFALPTDAEAAVLPNILLLFCHRYLYMFQLQGGQAQDIHSQPAHLADKMHSPHSFDHRTVQVILTVASGCCFCCFCHSFRRLIANQ